MRCFASGADRTGSDEFFGIGRHGRPPEPLFKEGQCAPKPRMAGNPGGVSPLKDRRSHHLGNKQPVGWTTLWNRLVPLGPLDHTLDLPPCCSNHTGGWHYGASRSVLHRESKLTWQRVRFDVLGSRSIGERKVEPPQEQCPPGLARVEPTGRTEVREVLMVRPHNEGMSGSLKPVPPLLKSQDDRQQLPVPDVIVPLCQRELAGEEGTRVLFKVRGGALIEHGPHPGVGSIYLHDKLWSRVWVNKNRCRWKQQLKFCSAGDHTKGILTEVSWVRGVATLL